MRSGERAFIQLNTLKLAGVRIAVDDFGTGYSSLAYIKRMPAHCVKLDRSFIQDLGSEARDLQLVTSMIKMLQDLEFPVVAEGIETADIYRSLARAGCDEAQGFLIAKPLSACAFESWISESPTQKELSGFSVL